MKYARLAAMLAVTAAASPAFAARDSGAMAEALSLLATESQDSGRPAYSPGHDVAFRSSDHVFVKSALGVDFTYRNATVTLPLFRGVSPSRTEIVFIITDASDFQIARRMGVNYAPKLTKAVGPVTLAEGHIRFQDGVDFAPVYHVEAGDVLPSGLVLNAQIVHNGTGPHDRVTAIDLKNLTVTLSILDGVQGGRQYFYHLVTDASAPVPAVLEKGVYAPMLARLPAFGQSAPGEHSALLGFSPVLNGRTDKGSGQDQGFSTALAHGGIDPINVFPIGPQNDNVSPTNNYSPLWDAHVSMWTPAAISAAKVHRIHSMDEQKALIREGLLTSAFINPLGPGNPYVGGLRPTQAIINCAVIAHPELPPQ